MNSLHHQQASHEPNAIPRSAAELRDTTKCPACFTELLSATCHACGLDLRHAQSATLAAVSAQAADLLDRRAELIATLRSAAALATAASVSQPAASVPATSTPVDQALISGRVHTEEATRPRPTDEPSSADGAGDRARRSGVQVALLVTGISLLSVFAIFFMVYAFINYGIVWRSLIIGAITVTTIATATVLRRRSLGASSEAVSVFALVLIYLDAFAVRANDLFGLAAVDARLYWGAVLLGSGVAFIAWYRLARLRAASLVGYAVIPIGVAVVTSAYVDSLSAAAATYVVAIAASLAGLVQHTAWLNPPGDGVRRPARPERILVLATSGPALLTAAGASFGVAPDFAAGASLALLGCVAVAGLYLALHSRSAATYDRVVAAVAGGALGVFAGLAGAAWALRNIETLESPYLAFAAPTLAVALLILLTMRVSRGRTRTPLLVATASSAMIAAFALLPAAAVGTLSVVAHLAATAGGSRRPPGAPTLIWESGGIDAVAALILAIAAGAIAAAMTRTVHRVAPFLAAAAVPVALIAGTLLPTLWLVLLGWIAVGVVGLLSRALRPGLAPVAAMTAAVGGFTLAWIAGWGSDATWPVTSLVTAAALAFGHRVARTRWARPALVAIGTLVVVIAGAATAEQYSSAAIAAAAGALAAGALVLGTTAVARFRLGVSDRRSAFWTSLGAAVIATAVILSVWGPGLPLPFVTIGAALLVTLAVTVWAAAGTRLGSPTEQRVSAVLVAPFAAFALSAAAITGLPQGPATHLAPALVAAIVAGVALLVSTSGSPGTGRVPRAELDAGAALALVPSIAVALNGDLIDGWLALALVAITVALAATSADGLVASQSARRHLGWLALAFATIALWWALDAGTVSQPEPYVLPPALALICVALLIRRREIRGAHPTEARVSPWVLLLGLLLAVVPLALSSTGYTDVELARAIATLAFSGALLIGSAHVWARNTANAGAAGLAAAAASVGVLGALLVTARRSAQVITVGTPVEIWLAPATLALVIAAVILARADSATGTAPEGQVRQRRLPSARNVGMRMFQLAIVFAVAVEGAAAGSDGREATLRVTLIVTALAALHVASVRWTAAPLGPGTGWLALGLGAVTAVLFAGRFDDIELVTLPLAAALVAGGAITLSQRATARSWPHLGPGIALLLLPTLISTFTDPELWRLVGLGVAGVLVIVAGATMRLQAPFVLGTAVVLVHALRTFAPQLRAVYEAADWYIWAGVGGVILIAIAIRYEQRMRDVRLITTRISALR